MRKPSAVYDRIIREAKTGKGYRIRARTTNGDTLFRWTAFVKEHPVMRGLLTPIEEPEALQLYRMRLGGSKQKIRWATTGVQRRTADY